MYVLLRVCVYAFLRNVYVYVCWVYLWGICMWMCICACVWACAHVVFWFIHLIFTNADSLECGGRWPGLVTNTHWSKWERVGESSGILLVHSLTHFTHSPSLTHSTHTLTHDKFREMNLNFGKAQVNFSLTHDTQFYSAHWTWMHVLLYLLTHSHILSLTYSTAVDVQRL